MLTSTTSDGSTNYSVKNEPETVEITVFKTADDGTTALTGATFTLTRLNDSGTFVNYGDGIYTVSTAEATKGRFTVKVTVGTYKLTETVAPDGYVIITSGIYFIVSKDSESGDLSVSIAKMNEDGTITATTGEVNQASISDKTITVKNTPGVALPSTGGMGTGLFYLLGAVLLLGVGVLLMYRRRLG